MARNLFGGSSDDYVVDSSGKPVTNRRIRFYTSAAMTTEVTDLASDVAGTGTPLTVLSNTVGFWGPIYGPDAGTVMYAGAVDASGNPPSYVVAVYTHTSTGGVTSFNTRTGPITLSKADVTGTGLAAADVSADASGTAAAAQAASAQKSANLSDLASATTARTNLGLGTAATQPTTAFDAAGTAATVQTNLTSEVTRAQAAEAALGGGMQFRTAVVVATTNQALTGLPTIDAVTLTGGQVILLTGQTAGSQNGLWAVASGAWARPSNFAAGADATATSVLVESGTTGAGTTYAVTGTTNNVIGTNVLTFVKTSGTAASGSTWQSDSAFGSTYRQATEILMSVYDTNAADTDHTAAFVAAFAAAKTKIVTGGANHVRIILDSRRHYKIGAGGVVAGANNQWSIVNLPFSTTAIGVIELVGIPRAGGEHGLFSFQQESTVIESTLSAAPSMLTSRGIASMFGGPASYKTTAGQPTASWLSFAVSNVTFRQQANPLIAGIDAGYLQGFWFSKIGFDTVQTANWSGVALSSLTLCTNNQACPMIFPLINNGENIYGDTLFNVGYKTGPVVSELCVIDEIITACTPGAALNLDGGGHANHIRFLWDVFNSLGIAAYDANNGGGTVNQSIAVNGYAGGGPDNLWPAPLVLGHWEVEGTNGTGPGGVGGALDRFLDVYDQTNIGRIESTFQGTNSGSGASFLPKVFGSGGSFTGAANGIRVRALRTTAGVQTPPSVPASTTAIRNPFARDALVTVAGGTVTAITVNGTATGVTSGAVFVPACASVAITYSVAPTWVWQTL